VVAGSTKNESRFSQFKSSHQSIYKKKRMKVDATTVLDAKLMASGGRAIWIRPLKVKKHQFLSIQQ